MSERLTSPTTLLPMTVFDRAYLQKVDARKQSRDTADSYVWHTHVADASRAQDCTALREFVM
eukprot:32138-Eustigmatos_ZCMA.PRE.1